MHAGNIDKFFINNTQTLYFFIWLIIKGKQRNGNTSIQIFENVNYLKKYIVSAYFTREKDEKIGKNEM